VTEITVGPLVVVVPLGVPALIQSFLLACVICFTAAAFWITLSLCWHWLVALLALTACLTTVFPRIAWWLRLLACCRERSRWGCAEITVVWSDERHTIVLSPADWQRVKAGFSVTRRGGSYIYREEWFGDIWRFNGPTHELVVDYDYSDGERGTGYNGSLSSVHIMEGPRSR
jgi:hypothetical protein